MSNALQNFFTLESFGTLGGASLIVVVLTNTYRTLTKQDHPLIAFIAAELVAFICAWQAHALVDAFRTFVAFLNGCLLFCSALGLNETAVNAAKPAPAPGAAKPFGAARGKWLKSWFE
jgi:hypothetical protein